MPIGIRLTLWFVMLLGIVISVWGVQLYDEVVRIVRSQTDRSLQLVSTQVRANVVAAGDRLVFADGDDVRQISRDVVIIILSPEGEVWDRLGERARVQAVTELVPGYSHVTESNDDDGWRTLLSPVNDQATGLTGWLQVSQSWEAADETLEGVSAQIQASVPILVIISGAGGVILLSRVLRPIDSITRHAQSINVGDLSRRIAYNGPKDELGRLAQTFDDMLDRLQSAFERERRFTADASHELRTPLTALKGQIGVVLSQPRNPDEYRSALHDMEHEVNRLIRLGNDLLFMARFDRENRRVAFELIEMSTLLLTIVDQVTPLASERDLTFATDFAPDLNISGDMDLLIRLFMNLLDNAIKYTPRGGTITLRASHKPATRQISVSIHNTGAHIPAEHVTSLFDRFYRVEADRARSLDSSSVTIGAGLGLAIVQEIVETHNGHISVASVPADGVTFTVDLPAA